MPFVSQAQAGWAFANKKPFAKRWAKQTGPYKRLPYKKGKKDIVGTVSTAVAPTGPGGLMSAPGMGSTKRTRKKAFTLQQLEAFVCSPHYDPATAQAIASGIPALPSLKGEQIAPGITRIHGNLCNVHGRYGHCPGSAVALSPKPKPRRGRKPRKGAKPKIDRQAQHAANRTATLSSAGYSASDQAALAALRDGTQPVAVSPDLLDTGLVEQAADGSYRMTASGRALLAAADQGDAGRVHDIASSATDRTNARSQRRNAAAQRQQAAATRRAQAAANRAQAHQARLAKQHARLAKQKPAKSGGGKTPAKAAPAHVSAPAKPRAPAQLPTVQRFTPKPPPKAPKPTKAQTTTANQQAVRGAMAQADQGLAPGGFDNLIALGGGKEPDKIGADGLISMGMAERGSDGTLRLTSAGRAVIAAASRGDAKAAIDVISRASEPKTTRKTTDYPDQSQFAGYTMEDWNHDRPAKRPSPKAVEAARQQFARALGLDTVAQPSTFKVFKDATGRARWVAQSSTAYQDRDKEIVSVKALADDCAFADRTGSYGPLRWWHTPGLDLGDCDFNAMHGKVLLESGTFRSPAIAQKVARAAGALEISLGFLHLPTEPDAAGVFHHIRKFERSLVPRGKASNRFTAFRVKESPMFDPTKVAALKQLGFSDADITNLQVQAEATEKAADAQQVAYKSEDAANLDYPDLEINGVTYKAFPPKAAVAPPEGSPAEEAAESPEDEAAELAAGEAPDADDAGGLTLSPEDMQAIGAAVAQALQTALGPLVSTMDLTNKIGSHMDELKSMMGGYQTTQAKKDASDAEKTEQIAALQTALKETQTKLNELLGLQPAGVARATQAAQSIVDPFNPADNKLLQSIKDQVPPDQLPQYRTEFEDLKIKLFGS